MPKYAHYDANPPHQVLGWFDTDLLTYANIPSPIVEVPQEQWDRHIGARSLWTVVDGAIVETPVEIAPPPPQEVELREKGIQVFIRRNRESFAIHPSAQAELGQLARDIQAGLGLPGGGDTHPIMDRDHVEHELTADQIVELYQQVRGLGFAFRRARQRRGDYPNRMVAIK